MPNGFIFSVLILSTLLFPCLGKASYLMTHDRFYALSVEEQNQVIIKTMEMASELESQFPHDKVSKLNLQTRKKFSFILNHLQNLILTEAFADPEKAKLFENYGQDFIRLTSGPGKKEKCLYAGWVSKLKIGKTKEGKEILNCSHPQTLDKNTDEYKAYVKAEKSCDSNNNKISCNPAIFGFKKGSDQSLFCVDAGLVSSVDSSFECMKLSLAEFPKDQTKVDSKETRLKLMRETLAAKPELLEGVQRFMFKTCFCENNENSIDKRYLRKVRPHRTCYGLMRTIGETTSCQIDGSTLANVDDFKIITNNLKEDIYASSLKKANYDSFYQEFLENARKNSQADFSRICNAQTPVPTPAPAEEPKSKENSDSPYTCSVTCSDTAARIPIYPSADADQYSKALSITRTSPTVIDISAPPPTVDVSKPYDPNQPPAEDTNWAQAGQGNEQKPVQECKYIVNKKIGNETKTLEEDVFEKFSGIIDADTKVSIKIKEDKSNVECSVTKTDPANNTDEENSCSLNFEILEEKKRLTARADLKNEIKGIKTYKWENNDSETAFAPFELVDGLVTKVTITLPDNSQISCEKKYEKEKPADGTKFEIIPGEVTLTSKKFSVKINDKAEIPSGFIVIWFRNEAGQKLDLKKPDSDKPKVSETPTVAPDSDAPKAKDEKKPNEEPKDEVKGEVGRGPEITEFRSPLNTFKICAQLVKEGSKVDEKCSDVPKIEGPRNQGSGRPNVPFVNPIHNPANWTNDGVY